MKKILFGGLLAGATLLSAAQANETSEIRVIQRGPHHNKIQTVKSVTNHHGRVVAITNSYVQLQTGLNFKDEQGEWLPTRAEFEITAHGVEAKHTPHKVALAANINSIGAVDVVTPDNVRIKSHPIGIGLYDPVSGASVLLGETRDSIGLLVETNVVLYTNAFNDVPASVRYVLTPAGPLRCRFPPAA